MNRTRGISVILIVFSVFMSWGKQSIVPASVTESGDYALAVDFICRYASLLDDLNRDENRDAIRRTREDGFRFLTGDDNTLRMLTGREDFRLSFDGDGYTVTWSENGRVLVSCSFPANIGMLTFSNKIELENAMIDNLNALLTKQPVRRSLPVRHRSALSRVSCSDYLVEDCGFYLTPRLQHQVVYEPIGEAADSCRMLVDNGRYTLESVANILLTGYAPCHTMVNVRIRQYGYKTQSINVPFTSLYDVLSENNSKPYWGVETFDGKEIKGVYVWRNEYGGYNHMLSMAIPVDALSRPSTLQATLHCYIRTDNLKSLFAEYPEI